MNMRARICLLGSALALSLIGSAGAAKAQTTTVWTWTPYDYPTARVHALQAMNDADLTKQDIASVIGLLRDLRDAEMNYTMASAITTNDLTAHTGTQNAGFETRVNDARRIYMDKRESVWRVIHERLGDKKANALHDLVEFSSAQPMTTTYYYNNADRIRRIDEIFTWWDNRNSGQTVVATTTVTTDPSGRAHRDIISTNYMGVAPLTYRDLVELMESKLIAMTGSPDTAWILQGMYGGVASDDLKFAREKSMRVWEWP